MRTRNVLLIILVLIYGIITGCGEVEEIQEETTINIDAAPTEFEELRQDRPVSDKPLIEAINLEKEVKQKAIVQKASEVTTEATTEAATEAPTEEPAPSMTFYATLELTAYEWTGYPCADGVYPVEWWTVASNDPGLWHRRIHIEGYGDFYVHDTGGMSMNVLDLYLGDVDACYQFGRRTANVYVYD